MSRKVAVWQCDRDDQEAFSTWPSIAGWAWVVPVALAVAAPPIASVTGDGRLAPVFAAAVYPSPRAGAAPVSEVAFRETPETRRYGFNVPFPAGRRRIFVVDDYGARPDGATDCTPAFARAWAAARRCSLPVELLFRRSGRYLFRPDPGLGSDDLAILIVRKAVGLRIRGQGAGTVLAMADPKLGGLQVTDSSGVMLQGFTIDYNPLPFTQGAVSQVDPDAGSFRLRTDAGYLPPCEMGARIPGFHGGYTLQQANGYRWLPIGGVTPRTPPSVEGDETRFDVGSDVARTLKTGDRFVFVGRRIAQTALSACFTRRFYVKDVTVHASPTCGLLLNNVDGACIDGYADEIPAGSNRLLATNADGLYVHNVRGGITIRNCRFMGQGDDCINLHTTAWSSRWLRPVGDREVAIASPIDLRKGDTIEIMDPNAGKIKGSIRVLSVISNAAHEVVRCRLAAPLSSVGYDAKTDAAYVTDLAGSNFKIVRCRFGQNRSRCMLIQARHGLIQANTIENAEGYGVVLGYGGAAWAEGIIPTDVTIRDNTFRNVTGVGLAPPIEANDGSPDRNFRRIVVEANRFVNPRKMAISVSGMQGLRISGNRVSTDPGRRNTWNHPQWYPVDCSISLRNCSGVLVDRLSLVDRSIREAAITIGADCAPGTVGVTLRGIRADLAPGVPVVRDERKAAPGGP